MQSVTEGHTDAEAQTNMPGHKKIWVFLFFILIPHIKFQEDPIFNCS